MLKLILLLSAAVGAVLYAYGVPLLPALAATAAIAGLATPFLMILLWLNGDR
jgi:hypothetical protein